MQQAVDDIAQRDEFGIVAKSEIAPTVRPEARSSRSAESGRRPTPAWSSRAPRRMIPVSARKARAQLRP